MHSYVTLAEGAPRGLRKRGLSKGRAAWVRGRVKSGRKVEGQRWVRRGAKSWRRMGYGTRPRCATGNGQEAQSPGRGEKPAQADPAARRATTAAATPGTRNRPDAKTRNGPDAVAFGARFWPRLRAMGTPA